MLQLAVMPGRETEWLIRGGDTVGGYVVKAEDVVWADTPAKLFEVHGLGFPGSPFTAETPFVDVIRMPSALGMNLSTPTGRPSDAGQSAMPGPFVDHPPFPGTGFAPGGDVPTPVWWLDPVRFPAGSELWRIHAGRRQEPLAVYPHVALGWTPVNGLQVVQDFSLRPSDVLGTFGTWQGQRLLVDLIDEETAVVAAASDLPGAGFTQSRRGVWWRTVTRADVADVAVIRYTATWRGVPVQLVLRYAERDGSMRAQVVYLGRNALEAEALGLQKLDAGYYQAFVPLLDLADLQGVESRPVVRGGSA